MYTYTHASFYRSADARQRSATLSAPHWTRCRLCSQHTSGPAVVLLKGGRVGPRPRGTGSANNVHVKDCRVGRGDNQSVSSTRTRTRLRGQATAKKPLAAWLIPAWQNQKTEARLDVLNDFVKHTPTAHHTAGASCSTRQVYAASRVKLPAPIWEPKAYSKTGPRICFPTVRPNLLTVLSLFDNTPGGLRNMDV